MTEIKKTKSKMQLAKIQACGNYILSYRLVQRKDKCRSHVNKPISHGLTTRVHLKEINRNIFSSSNYSNPVWKPTPPNNFASEKQVLGHSSFNVLPSTNSFHSPPPIPVSLSASVVVIPLPTSTLLTVPFSPTF